MRVFKVVATKAGGHVDVKFWTAKSWNTTMAGVGTLTMDEEDWRSLRHVLRNYGRPRTKWLSIEDTSGVE